MSRGESSSRSIYYVLLILLWLLQAVLRLGFAFIGIFWPEMMDQFLTVEVSPAVFHFLNVMFLALGVAGVVTAIGLWMVKKWGYWGTILVSLVTVVFDIWGMTIQFTAALGLIIPGIAIFYLYTRKSQL